MLLSTTSTIEGKTIKEYRGIVFGEAIAGINVMKDFSASIINFTGGRVQEYEEELVAARADAISEMMQRAEKIGANALVGVKIDTETIATSNCSMLMVMASGTAVVIE